MSIQRSLSSRRDDACTTLFEPWRNTVHHSLPGHIPAFHLCFRHRPAPTAKLVRMQCQCDLPPPRLQEVSELILRHVSKVGSLAPHNFQHPCHFLILRRSPRGHCRAAQTKLNGTVIPELFFCPLLMHLNENITYYFFRAIHHIDPLHRKQTLQFSRSHGQPLQKPREVQEMLKISVCQSSLVSRTFSIRVRIWMLTLCTMHLISPFTSEPRKEVKR